MADNKFKELKNLNNQEEFDSDKLITETGVSFRDRVSNIDKGGKRIWIHPKKPKGKFHFWRLIVAYFLIAFFAVMPFIEINGHQALLFNVIERKFVLFGVVFWPQDFHIFAIGFLIALVGIVLFTAVYGRIWCGWACPQTVFMEMVFRKIEYWLEGDAAKQKKLDKLPWNTEKVMKRGSKHVIFMVLSFFISNLLLAYVIGVDRLGQLISDGPFAHFGTFFALVLFSFVFYFIFSWFREQACTFVCPYGRLQSVLLDKNTIVVAYDHVRGEERGPYKRNAKPEGKGDCIDCGECVKVCPTGIDIRNGTQLECINCTACMDACDDVMDKMGQPRGLIRYASQSNIEEATKFKVTPRLIGYTLLLGVMFSVITIFFFNRSDIEATILRAKGNTYTRTDDNRIENVYTATILNKTSGPMEVKLKIEEIEGEIEMIGNLGMNVQPDSMVQATMIVRIPEKYVAQARDELKIGIYSGGEQIDVVKTKFSGPFKIGN
jgi:cytochrome c oxidase accessory protein FixG